MIRNMILVVVVVVFAAMATAALTYLCGQHYPSVLASKQARDAIDITESQQRELNQAAMLSDMVAFGILSATLCSGLAILIAHQNTMTKRSVGGLLGLVLGGVSGALAGWFGHWFLYNSPIDIQDPMVYHVVRWTAMFVPIAVACCIAVAIGGSFKHFGNTIVGAILGVIASSVVYALLSGVVTLAEPKHKVFPFYMSNQILAFFSTIVCIGIGIALSQTAREKPSVAK